MKRTLGIDPDTHDLAVAVWGITGPLAAQVIHVPRHKDEPSQVGLARALVATPPTLRLAMAGIERIAIEGQQIDGRRARPKDLFTLAHTAGSAISWCATHFPDATIAVPTPSEWKGGVAKHAMQARLYKELGWRYEIRGAGDKRYAAPLNVPSAFDHISAAQWKHVGDAILLARWAFNGSTATD